MKKTDFSVTSILGKKVYKYEDAFGNIGKAHYSTTKFSPFEIKEFNGNTCIFLPETQIPVSNLSEIDLICDAFENHKETLNEILSTPSEFIAKCNPELYDKLLDAIMSKYNLLEISKQKKESILPRNNKSSTEIYEVVHLIATKKDKISKELEKLKNQGEPSIE